LAFAAQDQTRLADAADQLTAALNQREAWLSGMNAPAWLRPRRAAELAWQRLVPRLYTADQRPSGTGCVEVWDALRTRLDAYVPARTGGPIPGLEATPGLAIIVEPAIENAILRQQSLLAALRRSVTELSKIDTPLLDAHAAELLLTRIETAGGRPREGHAR